jgi:rare lipoprotein A
MKRSILLILLILFNSRIANAAPGPQPEVRQGRASWYGAEWTTGKRGTMANGARFNPRAWSAATYDYPLGSVLLVTNTANGKRIAVMVTDRGPAHKLGRLIDLSEAAATALDYHRAGVTTVSVQVLVARGGNSQ